METFARTLPPILLSAAVCALAAGCSKRTDQPPTPMAATSLPAPEIGDAVSGGVGAPANGTAGTAAANVAIANGAFGGNEADTRQTAAVTPLANANGTVPASPGVGPAGGVALAGAASNSASMAGTGVAVSTPATQTAQARAATSAGVPASGQVATSVAPVGGVRGPSVTSGAVTAGGPSGAAPVAAAPVASAPGVAAGTASPR